MLSATVSVAFSATGVETADESVAVMFCMVVSRLSLRCAG
jgi:hypothetical protein